MGDTKALRGFGFAAGGLILVLIGMLLAGSGPSPSPPTSSPVPPAATAIDQMRAHTKTAAVAVAAAWLDATSSRTELLDAAAINETVERLVDPSARSDIADQLHQAAEAVRGSQQAPTPVVRSAPIGYRLTSYSDDHASVSSWEVVSRSSLQPPSALWARSDISLRWDDGWRVSGATSKLTDPRDWTAVELAAMDRAYRSFHHAP